MPAKKMEIVELKPIIKKTAILRIKGDTPLIVHNWSHKAKQEMLDKQMQKTKAPMRAKNPVEDFIESAYWIRGKPEEYTEPAFEDAVSSGARFGFPVVAIKAAAISGVYRMGASKDKASVQGAFFIRHDAAVGSFLLSEIKGAPPSPREDMVRVGMGTADIRYRAEFSDWHMDLPIEYIANGRYSLEQIVNMIAIGGATVGIGEWRVEKGGQNGMFSVVGLS